MVISIPNVMVIPLLAYVMDMLCETFRSISFFIWKQLEVNQRT